MTRQLCTTIIATMVATGLVFTATDAMGQVTMRFPTTRDLQLQANEGQEQLVNRGGRASIRPLKNNQDVSLLDFDTAAMGAFLAENPGTATWTLNIAPFPHGGSAKSILSNFIGTEEITMETIESTVDWIEGTGVDAGPGGPGGTPPLGLGWADGTAASTFYYAQTFQSGGVLDTANSLQWNDPDSGPYTFTTRPATYAVHGVPTTVGGGDANFGNPPTPEFINSVDWDWVALAAAQSETEFVSYVPLAMDDVIIDAMINDENNRGLRFGPLEFQNFNTNWRIYSREGSATVAGDFDDDGVVDGADFLEWQRDQTDRDLADWEGSFGSMGGGESLGPYLEVTITPPAVSAIPEPSSLLLLIAASSAMLFVCRGKRQTV